MCSPQKVRPGIALILCHQHVEAGSNNGVVIFDYLLRGSNNRINHNTPITVSDQAYFVPFRKSGYIASYDEEGVGELQYLQFRP